MSFLNLKTAPRDVTSLSKLPRAILFRLALSCRCLPKRDQELAFLYCDARLCAEIVADGLRKYDEARSRALMNLRDLPKRLN